MKITMKNHHLGPNPFGSLFPSIKQVANPSKYWYTYKYNIYIYIYMIYLEPRFDPLFLKVSPLKLQAFEPGGHLGVIWLEESTWHIFTPIPGVSWSNLTFADFFKWFETKPPTSCKYRGMKFPTQLYRDYDEKKETKEFPQKKSMGILWLQGFFQEKVTAFHLGNLGEVCVLPILP